MVLIMSQDCSICKTFASFCHNLLNKAVWISNILPVALPGEHHDECCNQVMCDMNRVCMSRPVTITTFIGQYIITEIILINNIVILKLFYATLKYNIL